MARETDLYPAVKKFLEAHGFSVKGEVGGCDVVGVKPGEAEVLVVCELKLGFTLELLLQSVDRFTAADAVWMAVPRTGRGWDRDPRVTKLCRLVGFGLLAVRTDGTVEVLADPMPYRPRPNSKRRRSLLREHSRRQGDPMAGGSVGREVMTAYRQRALACAAALGAGEASTRVVANVASDAPAILLRNVYGWFVRVRRGTYRLTPAGHVALQAAETMTRSGILAADAHRMPR